MLANLLETDTREYLTFLFLCFCFSIYQYPIKYSSACLCLSLKVCHSNRTEFGGSYVTVMLFGI